MKIKNHLIVALVQNGATNIISASLDTKSAYSIIKFRRALKAAFDEIVAKEKDAIEEYKLTVGENGMLEGEESNKQSFGAFRIELYNDESELENIQPLDFDSWHKLQQDNKFLQDAGLEDALENILWKAPEE